MILHKYQFAERVSGIIETEKSLCTQSKTRSISSTKALSKVATTTTKALNNSTKCTLIFTLICYFTIVATSISKLAAGK